MPIVSIVKTKGDDYPAIKAAVDQAIEYCGGLCDIIKPGDKVLINPNLVAPPSDRLAGCITRWEVSKAIAEAVSAVGGEPIIAESSGAGLDTEKVIQACDYQLLRDEGFQVIDLKTRPKVNIPVKGGVIVQELESWDLVAEADVIISVPVMKTHDQTDVTLGMKNLKGLVSDSNKKAFHFIGLVQGVVDIVKGVKPAMTIVDGTYGQQGLGPIYGETIKMDLIVASKDIVACDAVTSVIMGFEPDEPQITAAAYQREAGEMYLDKIQIAGERIEDVQKRFKRSSEVEIEGLPSSFTMIFAEQACTGCRNTVISSLMDMKAQELFPHLENMIIVAGPVKEEELPAHATKENTVAIGKCAYHLKHRARTVMGCPPGNVDVVQGILGPDIQYGIRHATDGTAGIHASEEES